MMFEDPGVGVFQVWDYVVFAALFVISSGIGIFFAVKERKKVSSREFLVGGKQMTCGPVALSLTASFMSAVTVLGTPSDVYRFGASFIIFGIAYTIMVIMTAELFVPVFYRSGITSTYEYLELRFSRTVRMAATLIYVVQTILYTGVVVYAPALALNQVTGFNLWGSIAATGVVCTFYCTLGGLKAVVWTDAFQMVVMLMGFLTVLIQGTIKSGGTAVVWQKAQEGSRLEIFDFDLDPLRRHTFWTITVGGTFTWLGIYGVNQSTIQRCISCKSEKQAKLALYFNLLGLLVILVCAVFSGLIMYSFYMDCDPWTAGFVSAPDQLMPYFVMDILGHLPGLPGLFVACAFSGTLSTVAASINALATVTYEDFVKYCFNNLTDRCSTWISKGLCVVFGVACTTMAVAAAYMGGVVQAALSIHGMCGGPMLGLFSLGILLPCTNWMGAVGGLAVGITLSFWAGIGAFVHPALPGKTMPLPLNTSGCVPLNTSDILTTLAPSLAPERPALADSWYSMSYLYYSAVGWLATMTAGLLISLVTGPQRGKDVKPLLIRPVCNLFCFWSEKCKTLCWCGVPHDEETVDFSKNFVSSDALAMKQGQPRDQVNGLSKDPREISSSSSPEDKAYINAGFTKDTYF
ncbi:sodium-coupled monocarboxylate transporter 2 [Lepisosteus oculatus]|uniref:sodium-coupled monocarboxylate transporter 2 n=1 Tax=Lepisosteus oculatus TaxID=7918 RepID=UPI00074026A8|nr:PREDICTED: sodium-coupled monocarboxylate transporter 2 [Lepisosteus oculatus]